MSATKNHLITFTLLMGLLLVGLIFVNGCKKEEPEPAATMTESDMSMAAEETQKESDMTAMAKKAEDMAKETKEKASEEMEEMKTVTLAMEQEKCPVMGQPINKELFTEYKGKKVYFCCDGCKEKFEANPEQYLAKLPQFQEE